MGKAVTNVLFSTSFVGPCEIDFPAMLLSTFGISRALDIFPLELGREEPTRGVIPAHFLGAERLEIIWGFKMKAFFARALMVAMLLMLAPAALSASTLISFDDLFDNGTGSTPIPYGYGLPDFYWSNFNVLNTPAYTGTNGPNGYFNGTVSFPNVAYDPFGQPAILKSFDFVNNKYVPFNFDSVYMNAAWDQGLQIEIQGYTLVAGNPTLTIDDFVTVNATTPATLFNFDFKNVVLLDFIPTCPSGCSSAGYAGSGTQFSMDNMTVAPGGVTPEPTSLALLGTGLVSLAGFARRRMRKS